MVSKVWRVRFAPSTKNQPLPADRSAGKTPTIASPHPEIPALRRQAKSKAACQECKLRRVKCDERYPVCGHCERRGAVCKPAPPKSIWKLEMPLLIQQAFTKDDGTSCSMLLQYYFERVCHIMVLDPEHSHNPLSLPLLHLFNQSSALLHVVQSIAAAHKNGFRHSDNLTECLVERKHALVSMQQELFQARKHPVATFLTIFLLGISSPWIEESMGLEHLVGARDVIDLLLNDPAIRPSDPTMQLIMGLYIWWEMASSFSLDHTRQRPLDAGVIYEVVQANQQQYHPLAGYSLDLFHIVANLNHYCRRIVDGEVHDHRVEASLEEQLLSWIPNQENELSFLLSDAYRKHGLIQLHRICGPSEGQSEQENEGLIQQWATEAMNSLLQIPLTSSYLNFQPIPLLSAASEIPADNPKQRQEIRSRFKALYSLNNLPVMLDAIDLLEEIWELRTLGITTPWLVIVHERGQMFPLA
ncbi:hypothetical protein Focb16_v000023 [Fusarium oxysporum f. sp. cubense]|uniref:Zn(2)-C6 fungal-type domain-containing protein n=1 Tax=Fusarium oxysporum f. sp. cubense TaxID=61366 RepID=A0A559L7K2_FUSOC|nr:hypothetical protein Focb16_v000023 [Fusarium oxysporum f. sp. cubense]